MGSIPASLSMEKVDYTLILQALKDRISWLERTNEELSRELHEYRSKCAASEPCGIDANV